MPQQQQQQQEQQRPPPPRGALGLNYNGQLSWISHSEIRQMGASWVRGFINMHSLPSPPAEDPNLAALLGAADAGLGTVLSLKWDYTCRDFPGAGTRELRAELCALERVLRVVGERVDVLVLGNEPFVEARPEQRGDPLNCFYEAVAEAAIAFFFPSSSSSSSSCDPANPKPKPRPRLYTGALNRLDLPARRTPAVERMLAFTAARPDLDGVDLHPHTREPGAHATMVRWALARLRPDQSFLATEFSMVWCWKAHMRDVVAPIPASTLTSSASNETPHPDLDLTLNLHPGARVHEVLDAMIASPTTPQQWRAFLSAQPWYATHQHFLRDTVRLYRSTGRLAVATYPYSPMRDRAQPLGPDGVPWLLNGVYAPSTVRREPGGLRPEGWPWGQEFRCAVAEGP